MLRTLSMLVLVVAACGDGDPETVAMCEAHPQAQLLHDVTILSTTFGVAVGGTVTLKAQCTLPDLPGQAPFDLDSIATADGDAIRVAKSGPSLTITGLHPGASTIRITTPDGMTTYGTLDVAVDAIDHLVLHTDEEVPPTLPVAFAKELGALSEVLLAASDGRRLSDDGIALDLPPGVARIAIRPGSFDYHDAPLGESTIRATAGGLTFTTPFVIVDHADTIALLDPAASVPPTGTDPTDICFAATAAGRFVSSLRWTIGGEGTSVPLANCAQLIASQDADYDGAITVDASAGTATATFAVPIH